MARSRVRRFVFLFSIVFAQGAIIIFAVSPRSTSLKSGLVNGALVIEPSVVDVGRLPLNATRKIHAVVINHTDRPMHLAKPITTCGCISAELSSALVAPRGEVALTVVVASPSEPKDIVQYISLAAVDGRDVSAQLKLFGVAESDIWAVPNVLVAELGASEESFVEGAIRYMAGKVPAKIIATSSEVSIEMLPSTNGNLAFRALIRSHSDGRCLLRVFPSEVRGVVQPILEIPVLWHPHQSLKFAPSELIIRDSERTGKTIERIVFVYVDPKKRDHELLLTSMASWLNVTQHRRLNKNVHEVRLAIDLATIPPILKRNTPVLAVSLNGNEGSAVFTATTVSRVKR